MSLLLDTHIALWGIAADPTLGEDFLDRMLIAQATTNGLTLVTRDADIRRYNVDTLVP
jgi:PIN domain nuclease of toxin-antitoxin system